MNLSARAANWGQRAGPHGSRHIKGYISGGGELPRGPEVWAGGLAEPSVAPRHTGRMLLAGQPWAGRLHVPALFRGICCLGWCDCVKRALEKNLGKLESGPGSIVTLPWANC